MKRISSKLWGAIALPAFALGIATTGATAAVYSKLTVKSEHTSGLVYVSTSDDNPDQSKYKAEMTASQNTGGLNTKPADHTYYIRAIVKPEDAALWYFDGWYEGETLLSNQETTPVTFNVTGKTALTPTVKTYTARFSKPALTASSPCTGTAVSMEPLRNKIGDKVHLKATVLPVGGIHPNALLRFEGWADAAGNIISTDPELDYTVTAETHLTARTLYLGETPKAGGYYRILTADGHALALRGNYKTGYVGVSSHDFTDTELEFISPDDERYYTDPATIFHIPSVSGDPNEIKAELCSQGSKVSDLFGGSTFTRLLPMDANHFGHYWIKTYNLIPVHGLQWKDSEQGKTAHAGNTDSSTTNGAFAFLPVDAEHSEIFSLRVAADPTLPFRDGYLTTYSAPFPFRCNENVTPYCITDSKEFYDHPYLQLTELPGGTVPANVPVILKCKSLDPAECTIMPVAADIETETPENDYLLSSASLYTDSQRNGKTIFNALAMRLLGVGADGRIGFTDPTQGHENDAPRKAPFDGTLAPNTAYLNLEATLFPDAADFRFYTGDMPTGIECIESEDDSDPHNAAIYNLQGIPVTNPQPGSLYIRHGRKIIW